MHSVVRDKQASRYLRVGQNVQKYSAVSILAHECKVHPSLRVGLISGVIVILPTLIRCYCAFNCAILFHLSLLYNSDFQYCSHIHSQIWMN